MVDATQDGPLSVGLDQEGDPLGIHEGQERVEASRFRKVELDKPDRLEESVQQIFRRIRQVAVGDDAARFEVGEDVLPDVLSVHQRLQRLPQVDGQGEVESFDHAGLPGISKL